MWLSKPASLCCIAVVGAYACLFLEADAVLPPLSWGVLSICVWLAYAVCHGWAELGVSDRHQLLWGVMSSALFLNHIHLEDGFQVLLCAIVCCGCSGCLRVCSVCHCV